MINRNVITMVKNKNKISSTLPFHFPMNSNPTTIIERIKSLTPTLKNSHEALAVFIHAYFEILGFRFLGLGEKGQRASSGDQLPQEWNESGEVYSFRYAHPQSSITFLVKILNMHDQVIVTGLGIEVKQTDRQKIM